MKQQLQTLCEELLAQGKGEEVFVVHTDGAVIFRVGNKALEDLEAFASLIAGTVAASRGLGALLHEKTIPFLVVEGESRSLIMRVFGQMVLVMVCSSAQSAGLAKYQIRIREQALLACLGELSKHSSSFQSPLRQLSDDDIDRMLDVAHVIS